jgi:hypothetical protein
MDRWWRQGDGICCVGTAEERENARPNSPDQSVQRSLGQRLDPKKPRHSGAIGVQWERRNFLTLSLAEILDKILTPIWIQILT